MAKRLKKEKVNVDVINFGEEVFSHERATDIHTNTQPLIIQFAVAVFTVVWSADLLAFFLARTGDEHREAHRLC